MAHRLPPPADGTGGQEQTTTAASGVVGTVAAFLPHVLHHAGLIAGAALLSGLLGVAAFAVLGLVAIVPLALRLRRRTGSWRAPLVAVAAFTVMFAVMTSITRTM
jgi:hypothetical protein